jgi:hypothetical protein
LLDGNQVDFVGEVNESQKQDFLGNAMAVLVPIDWPEPFGLVMIEAMACGEPVIAWRRGSVPEIVEHGVTGFIVDNEAEAIDAIKRIPTLDRRAVRAAFERRFTARRMAESYRRCFQGLAAKGHRRTGHAGPQPSYVGRNDRERLKPAQSRLSIRRLPKSRGAGSAPVQRADGNGNFSFVGVR